ncbi:hypothetical protein EE612_003740 [Oryza sativa]|nr:hypothetical protein EE612_003740 [Oryza sativa]
MAARRELSLRRRAARAAAAALIQARWRARRRGSTRRP